MKKLKKQKLLLKSEKFFKEQLWQHCLIISILLLFAWLFDRLIPALLFFITHLILRPRFAKQYHSNTTYACLFTTSTIIILGIYSTLPIEVSLLSSIPVATFVCWVGYIVQDRLDLIIKLSPTLRTMSDEDFENHCKLIGLTNEEIRIADLIIRKEYKGKYLYSQMGYSKRNAVRIKAKIFNKLSNSEIKAPTK